MQPSVRRVARLLRRRGYSEGTVISVVSPIRYQNRWKSKLAGIDNG